VRKNPSRTHECSEIEEFYYRKREREYLLYQLRGGSAQEEKEKEETKAMVCVRSFLYHLKLGGGEKLCVIITWLH
jgi:hypothetical protein